MLKRDKNPPSEDPKLDSVQTPPHEETSSASRDDIRTVQEMLKQLSPTSENSISISQIPAHCAKTLTAALNLEWFGNVDGSSSGNIIKVRIESLDMTLADFYEKIRGILSRSSTR